MPDTRFTAIAIIASIILPAAVQAKDWMSPAELARDLEVYRGFAVATLGIQFWEHIVSLPFEWSVYTGKLPWRHGMIAYIIIRYATWGSLVATLINIWSQEEVNCEGTLIALLVFFSLSTVTTSLIFVIRCIAVWKKNVFVTVPLLSVWATAVALQFTSALRIKSTWMMGGCQTRFTSPMWQYNLAFLFVEITDVLTFALSAWRLGDMRRMGIGKVLFKQSVLYIGVTTLLNTVCMAFIYANLNPILGYICSPFAMTMSGILACRSFRDLQLNARRSAQVSGFTGVHFWANSDPAVSPTCKEPTRRSPTELLADKGRRLGLRKKTDWLAKMGLDELELPSSPCTAAGVNSPSAQTLRCPPNMTQQGTTSFHGFLLPGEAGGQDATPTDGTAAVASRSSSRKPLRRGDSQRSLNAGSDGDVERDAELCDGSGEKDVRSAPAHRHAFSLDDECAPREEVTASEEQAASVGQLPRLRTGSHGSVVRPTTAPAPSAAMTQRSAASLCDPLYSTFHERSVDSQLSRLRRALPGTADSASSAQRKGLALPPAMPMVTYERQVEVER